VTAIVRLADLLVADVRKVGVPQPDAPDDPVGDLLAQRTPGDLLDEQPSDDVVGVAVLPLGAGGKSAFWPSAMSSNSRGSK
jgi:hypothetical protein